MPWNESERIVALARRGTLQEADWLELLAERAKDLEDHLHYISLASIQDLQIVEGAHIRPFYEPEVLGSYPLNTRGIFPKKHYGFRPPHEMPFADVEDLDPRASLREPRQKRHRLWGLTKRRCEWITIEVLSRSTYRVEGSTGYVRTDIVQYVIRKAEVGEMCAFAKRSPKQIWERLDEVLKEVIGTREADLKRLQATSSFFDHQAHIALAVKKLTAT